MGSSIVRRPWRPSILCTAASYAVLGLLALGALTGCGGAEGVAATVLDPIYGSGGGPPSEPPAPGPPTLPAADYIGTWAGPFSPPSGRPAGADLRYGTLTLTFSSSGAAAGMLATSDGQTGTVQGTLAVSGGKTTGYLSLTVTFAGRSTIVTDNTFIDAAGHLIGGLSLPTAPLPSDMATVQYTLTKQ